MQSGEMSNTTLSVSSRLQQAVALVGQVCQRCLTCLRWQLPAGWSPEQEEVRRSGQGSRSPACPGAEEIKQRQPLQHAATRRLLALYLAWVFISIGLSELISWMMSTICQFVQSVPRPLLAVVCRCRSLSLQGVCCNPVCCRFMKSFS